VTVTLCVPAVAVVVSWQFCPGTVVVQLVEPVMSGGTL
jgi:hypothetical protein